MMKNNIFLVGMLALCLLSACDFEKINTNPFEMTDEQGVWDGFATSGKFLTMQRNVALVGTQADGTEIVNQYQVAYNLSADVWSGYFGQNNAWNSGNNHLTNYLIDGWIAASYRNSYGTVLPSWKKIKEESEKSDVPEYFALAQILKISAWHKTTDMFGPIPYKEAGQPILVVPYDSQKDVYTYFFNDLEEAIRVLTKKAEAGSPIAPDHDAVYAGDAAKWVKYANSLMLRLAMRVRYADPVMAKKYAEMAVAHSIGVMTGKEDEAKMGQGAGFTFINNLETLANQYDECRMSSSMFSYLLGYEDPRLSIYFTPSVEDKENGIANLGVKAFDGKTYQGIPTGHAMKQNDEFRTLSKPNVEKTTPTYWMRTSEIYFLRSEGALEGWDMKGDAAALYEQGISMSFDENGININKAREYMTSGKKPINYSLLGIYAPAPTGATTEFTGSKENKLEKIIIQKWIAMYPNGQEAWSEWRRTGYPKLHRVLEDRGGLGEQGVRRMNYPASAYQSKEDRENIEKAIQMLGGADKPSTKLWWDAKK